MWMGFLRLVLSPQSEAKRLMAELVSRDSDERVGMKRGRVSASSPGTAPFPGAPRVAAFITRLVKLATESKAPTGEEATSLFTELTTYVTIDLAVSDPALCHSVLRAMRLTLLKWECSGPVLHLMFLALVSIAPVFPDPCHDAYVLAYRLCLTTVLQMMGKVNGTMQHQVLRTLLDLVRWLVQVEGSSDSRTGERLYLAVGAVDSIYATTFPGQVPVLELDSFESWLYCSHAALSVIESLVERQGNNCTAPATVDSFLQAIGVEDLATVATLVECLLSFPGDALPLLGPVHRVALRAAHALLDCGLTIPYPQLLHPSFLAILAEVVTKFFVASFNAPLTLGAPADSAMVEVLALLLRIQPHWTRNAALVYLNGVSQSEVLLNLLHSTLESLQPSKPVPSQVAKEIWNLLVKSCELACDDTGAGRRSRSAGCRRIFNQLLDSATNSSDNPLGTLLERCLLDSEPLVPSLPLWISTPPTASSPTLGSIPISVAELVVQLFAKALENDRSDTDQEDAARHGGSLLKRKEGVCRVVQGVLALPKFTHLPQWALISVACILDPLVQSLGLKLPTLPAWADLTEDSAVTLVTHSKFLTRLLEYYGRQNSGAATWQSELAKLRARRFSVPYAFLALAIVRAEVNLNQQATDVGVAVDASRLVSATDLIHSLLEEAKSNHAAATGVTQPDLALSWGLFQNSMSLVMLFGAPYGRVQHSDPNPESIKQIQKAVDALAGCLRHLVQFYQWISRLPSSTAESKTRALEMLTEVLAQNAEWMMLWSSLSEAALCNPNTSLGHIDSPQAKPARAPSTRTSSGKGKTPKRKGSKKQQEEYEVIDDEDNEVTIVGESRGGQPSAKGAPAVSKEKPQRSTENQGGALIALQLQLKDFVRECLQDCSTTADASTNCIPSLCRLITALRMEDEAVFQAILALALKGSPELRSVCAQCLGRLLQFRIQSSDKTTASDMLRMLPGDLAIGPSDTLPPQLNASIVSVLPPMIAAMDNRHISLSLSMSLVVRLLPFTIHADMSLRTSSMLATQRLMEGRKFNFDDILRRYPELISSIISQTDQLASLVETPLFRAVAELFGENKQRFLRGHVHLIVPYFLSKGNKPLLQAVAKEFQVHPAQLLEDHGPAFVAQVCTTLSAKEGLEAETDAVSQLHSYSQWVLGSGQGQATYKPSPSRFLKFAITAALPQCLLQHRPLVSAPSTPPAFETPIPENRPDLLEKPRVVFSACIQRILALEKGWSTPDSLLRLIKHRKVPLAAGSKERVGEVIFAILDYITKHLDVTFEPELLESAATERLHATLVGKKLWLESLALLVSWLGDQATTIANKLPPLLECCLHSEGAAVAQSVALVWWALVNGVSDTYLDQHGASMAVHLLALEKLAPPSSDAHYILKEGLLTLLYRTSHADFSIPLRSSLSYSSKLLRSLVNTLRTADQGNWRGARPGTREAFQQVVDGVLIGLRGRSQQCRTIYMEALHELLLSFGSDPAAEAQFHAYRPKGVVGALLRSSRKDDPNTQLLALKCIGLIGAVDSASDTNSTDSNEMMDRLPIMMMVTRYKGDAKAALSEDPSSYTRHFRNAEEIVEVLPFDLWQCYIAVSWKKLARELLARYLDELSVISDARMHDRAAFAIQLLLRTGANEERVAQGGTPLANVDPLRVEELGRYRWWSTLPERDQSILLPFASTTYELHVLTTNQRRGIQLLDTGMPYHIWLLNWFLTLLPHTKGVHGKLFDTARNVAKRDERLLAFLIPHLCLNIILSEPWPEGPAGTTTTTETGPQLVHDELRNLLMLAAVPQLSEHVLQGLSIVDALMLFRDFCVSQKLRSTTEREKDPKLLSQTLHGLVQRDDPISWDAAAQRVTSFLSRLGVALLVKASIQCRSTTRALRYLENDWVLPTVDQAEILCGGSLELQKIFAELQQLATARYLHDRRATQSLPEMALSYEMNGQWTKAQQCAELVLQREPASLSHHLTLLHCMKAQGQLHLMWTYVKSRISNSRTTSSSSTEQSSVSTLQYYAQEAAWRLNNWDGVREAGSEAGVGPALAVLARLTGSTPVQGTVDRQKLLFEVASVASRARRDIHRRLMSVSQSGFQNMYPQMVELQMLADIESAAALSCGGGVRTDPTNSAPIEVLLQRKQFAEYLENRRGRLVQAPEGLEPLFALHRALVRMLKLPDGLDREANLWVQQGEVFSKSSLFPAALAAVRHAAEVSPSNETWIPLMANILYDMGDRNTALTFAESKLPDRKISPVTTSAMIVLGTTWRQETNSKPPQEIVKSYEEAIRLAPQSEDGYHQLALFYDKLFETHKAAFTADTTPQEQLDVIDSYAEPAIRNFSKALQLGSKSQYKSLPRFFTLTLDCVALMHSPKAGKDSKPTEKILATLEDFARNVNNKTLICALPQLISRINHPHSTVQRLISQMILRLLGAFPRPVLWSLLCLTVPQAVSSITAPRRLLVQQILETYKTNPLSRQRLESAEKVFSCFLSICNTGPEVFINGGKLTSQSYIKSSQADVMKSKMIIPVQATMTPSMFAMTDSSSEPSWEKYVIQSFHEQVEVMSSLQKPKKIGVVTEGGMLVHFLCKSKDEPRKDMRMMELASMLNTMFLEDQECKVKGLRLRRYAVTALSDDCAAIEWVEGLLPLRKACDELYALCGKGMKTAQLKLLKDRMDKKQLTPMVMLKDHILPSYPPVLHRYFQTTFNTPQSWFEARRIYTISVATWSMVGHIVGLGDRHCENLMLDTINGEILHVDFACMFDKGENLDVPERVRFRLTQNIVDGLGMTGVEGEFRQVAELCLGMQAKNKLAVISLLETFLHDPLVEWLGRSNKVDPKLLMGRVRRRLNGHVDLYGERRDTLVSLSVGGQVEKLVQHASSWDSLCLMYMWWMPWL